MLSEFCTLYIVNYLIHSKVSNMHAHGLMHELKYKRFLLSEKN